MQIWMMTIPTTEVSKRELLFRLRRRAKRWQFGIEVGTHSGYEHYQIRYECSNSDFAEERRFWTGIKCELQQAGGWSEYECKDGNFYTSLDSDLGKYRFGKLKGIQLLFNSHGRKQGDRKITLIVDKCGSIGKTFWGRWSDLNGKATYIDGTDTDNIIRDIFDTTEKKPVQGTAVFIIDLSRADKQDNKLFARLETLKNGYLNDGRYAYRRMWIRPPIIYVLTNQEPDDWNALTKDRWDKIYVNVKYHQEWKCKELEFGD